MDNTNEKIQLDDITFDDVISGEGVETTPVAEEPVPPAKEEVKTEDVVEETPAADPVLEDIEEEEDEIQDDIQEYEDKKEDVEDDEEDEDYDDDTIVGSVLDKLGYEVDDQYDDTTEGLVQMTKDIASTMADERMEEVLDKFPLVKQHLQYVLE